MNMQERGEAIRQWLERLTLNAWVKNGRGDGHRNYAMQQTEMGVSIFLNTDAYEMDKSKMFKVGIFQGCPENADRKIWDDCRPYECRNTGSVSIGIGLSKSDELVARQIKSRGLDLEAFIESYNLHYAAYSKEMYRLANFPAFASQTARLLDGILQFPERMDHSKLTPAEKLSLMKFKENVHIVGAEEGPMRNVRGDIGWNRCSEERYWVKLDNLSYEQAMVIANLLRRTC